MSDGDQKKYLTADGLEKLKNEVNLLKNIVRKEITERIEEALKLGDLSENAEYHEAKEAQGMNEAKIRELEDTIKNAEIIETDTKINKKCVNIGCTIEIKTGNTAKEFTIVGSSEANPIKGLISNESPIGSAFMGHREGDDVEVETPMGKVNYKILKIK